MWAYHRSCYEASKAEVPLYFVCHRMLSQVVIQRGHQHVGIYNVLIMCCMVTTKYFKGLVISTETLQKGIAAESLRTTRVEGENDGIVFGA
jgi:hypothetical protein